jgi:hypothetical protein
VQKLGIPNHILRGDYDSHLNWRDLPNENWKKLPVFSFVRHPLAWIKSRWSKAVEDNTIGQQTFFGIHRRFDELIDPTSFQKTVEAIIKREPGILGATYKEMFAGIGGISRQVQLFKTENLPTVAYTALKRFEGIPDHFEQLIKEMPKENSSSTVDKFLEQLSALPDSLVAEYLESEKEAIQIWNSAE